ncbi:unnamed protein product [Durusdinium trenchii]|uniref:Uncharacterized protein n=2 Tax=Durusdinium trenchii TaxID=1381693 RepID=A0ABP0INP4_9DINO
MALIARACARPKEIFGQLVSDHVPQEFTFLGPTAEEVRVFNWNIMGRALCRTSAGEAVTNNGLDLDESVEDYIRRLQEKVAPRLSAWIRTGSVRWVACLQEAPNHRHLRRDFLQEVQAGVPDTVQLQSADLAATAFTCTMTLWDAATWELQHCAHGGAEVLCTVLAEEREDPRRRSLRVLNCHFPLETDQTAAIAHVGELLSESPAQQLVLVLGDLKLDLGHEGANQALMDGYRAGTASEEATLASGFVPGSAVYDWTRVTCDGAVLAPGKAASEPWAAVPTGSALKRWDPLQGLSCEDFISQYIHYALQDRVRHLPELSGEELGCLGAHHFGDQATELARLLEKNRAAAQAPEMESSCSATSRPAVSLQTAEAPAPKCSSLRAAIAASQQNEEELPVNRRFSPEGRQAFIQKHVHRKLQSSVADLDDEALWLLGQLHFSDQPTELPRFLMPRPTGFSGFSNDWQADLHSKPRRFFAADWSSWKARLPGSGSSAADGSRSPRGRTPPSDRLVFGPKGGSFARFVGRGSKADFDACGGPCGVVADPELGGVSRGGRSVVQRHGCHLVDRGARECRGFG